MTTDNHDARSRGPRLKRDELTDDEFGALHTDAWRWRFFREQMDESEKLFMLANGTNHYDERIDYEMNVWGDENGHDFDEVLP